MTAKHDDGAASRGAALRIPSVQWECDGERTAVAKLIVINDGSGAPVGGRRVADSRDIAVPSSKAAQTQRGPTEAIAETERTPGSAQERAPRPPSAATKKRRSRGEAAPKTTQSWGRSTSTPILTELADGRQPPVRYAFNPGESSSRGNRLGRRINGL